MEWPLWRAACLCRTRTRAGVCGRAIVFPLPPHYLYLRFVAFTASALTPSCCARTRTASCAANNMTDAPRPYSTIISALHRRAILSIACSQRVLSRLLPVTYRNSAAHYITKTDIAAQHSEKAPSTCTLANILLYSGGISRISHAILFMAKRRRRKAAHGKAEEEMTGAWLAGCC